MWLGIILVVIGLIILFICLFKGDDIAVSTMGSTLLVVIGTIILISVWGNKEPEPIDVYRGHTTLQITYQDSVALDSTVVWMDKYNPNKK